MLLFGVRGVCGVLLFRVVQGCIWCAVVWGKECIGCAVVWGQGCMWCAVV